MLGLGLKALYYLKFSQNILVEEKLKESGCSENWSSLFTVLYEQIFFIVKVVLHSMFLLFVFQGVSYCTPCPAGFACPTPMSLSGACSPGTYSLKGDATCNNCSAGFMCPSTSQPPIACQLGQTTFGNINQLNCSECPAGSACLTPR